MDHTFLVESLYDMDRTDPILPHVDRQSFHFQNKSLYVDRQALNFYVLYLQGILLFVFSRFHTLLTGAREV